MPCSPSKPTTGGGCTNCTCRPATSSSAGAGAAVSLPARQKTSNTESTPLLWHTSSQQSGYEATNPSTVTAAATEANVDEQDNNNNDDDDDDACPHGNGQGCCRQAKHEERTLIDPDLVRDCIVGLSDGLTVPFALTAGLSSVGSSRLVVLAGLAELVSGAISMGIGGFLSAQAELSHFHYHEKTTQARLERSCDDEIDRQVEQILKDYGVEKGTCRRVAAELRRKEEERREREREREVGLLRRNGEAQRARKRRVFGFLPLPSSSNAVKGDVEASAATTALPATTTDDDDSTTTGLTPFLLRVGSGLEPISTSRLYISALTIGASYFIGGAIPLLPYVFIDNTQRALLLSIIVTGLILLVFGVVKQHVTGAPGGWTGYAYGAVSTLAVGGVAAGASWAIVGALEK